MAAYAAIIPSRNWLVFRRPEVAGFGRSMTYSKDGGNASINQFVYSLDAGDRLTSVVETQNSTTTTYGHDSESQLTSAGNPMSAGTVRSNAYSPFCSRRDFISSRVTVAVPNFSTAIAAH